MIHEGYSCPWNLFTSVYIYLVYYMYYIYKDTLTFHLNNNIDRGKSPITDPLLIPTPSRISVNIRDIKK